MSSHRTTWVISVVFAAALLALAGCVPPAVTSTPSTSAEATQTTVTQQASVEPSASSAIKATGPITSPSTGSDERKNLLDAARQKLGIDSQFYVYQLYVQGDTALGDLEPVSKSAGGRMFIAWERKNGTWLAIAALNYGSSAANAASTARALPSFSSELIAKINWTLAAKPHTATLSASSAKSGLSSAAKEWSKSAMNGQGQPYAITLVKVAKDTKGNWWGRVITQPKGEFERLQFWAKYTNGAWDGSVQDPEPPPPSTYFPSSVVGKMGF